MRGIARRQAGRLPRAHAEQYEIGVVPTSGPLRPERYEARGKRLGRSVYSRVLKKITARNPISVAMPMTGPAFR